MHENTNGKSTEKNYKSPKQKLLQFFNRSRDQWKEKCQLAKYKLKLVRNKVRYLENNKAVLKKTIDELEKELQQMKRKEMEYGQEIERLKKNLRPKI